jgi:hypothetical protein
MELKQKRGLKIVATIGVVLAFFASAHAQEVYTMRLKMADSLFVKKQYTQSLELYQQIFDRGSFTPAMLLRMAFIEEGLGKTSRSLFYLTIYYNYTRDEQALLKMEDVATRDNLTGYEISGNEKFIALLEEYRPQITMLLAAISVLLFSLVFVFRKNKHHAFAPFVLMIIFLLSLGVFVNIDLHKRWGIISDSQVYLMSGPSPGSKVVAIVSDGHRLAINGKQDVWTRVQWGEGNVYVKENQVLEVKL